MHLPLDDVPCAEDGVFCTEDRCEAGVCQHHASDMRCDRGECVIRACAPANPEADRKGCVLVRGQNGTDGAACTGDGFSCTDDECMRGVCLHFPFSSRCGPRNVCTAAACAPGRPEHDPDGCTVGPPRAEGEECADDADACTLDVCRAGTCAHEPDGDETTCSPVREAFRQTTAVGTLAAELRSELPQTDAPAIGAGVARLTRIEAQLELAAAALDGRAGPAPALAARPAEVSAMPAAQRARIAFTMVLKTPRDVQAFLQTLAQARAQAALNGPEVRHLRARGRALRRSARTLRANLRLLALAR